MAKTTTIEIPEAVKTGWKAFFAKNGKFSKTATFATIANVMVLGAYALSLVRGAEVFGWTIPEFDAVAAAAILAIVNGTYVGNKFAEPK